MAAELVVVISKLLGLVRTASFEPLLVGPAILAITRGPPQVQEWLQRTLPYIYRDKRRLERLIKTLQALFALGVLGKVNNGLNALARSHWHFRKPGQPWDFSGAVEIAVITGGCSGFGHLMVQGLAGKAKIAILDVQDMPEDLKHLPGVTFYQCDITDRSAVAEVASTIRADIGHPSILINNAGIGRASTILDASEDYIEKLFKVNLLSHWTLIKEFLPSMLDQKKGHIVAIASMASYLSGAELTDYCASKAGVLALHEGLNSQLKHRYPNGRCINTTIVHPMWAATPLIADWKPALEAAKAAILPASAVSDAVVKQVLSGRSAQIFCPPSASRISTIRAWPTWMQELMRDAMNSTKHKIDGGRTLVPQT